jgi:CheY-like chemotaxis protein
LTDPGDVKPTQPANARPLAGGTVLVVEGNLAETTAFQTVLGMLGARVEVMTEARLVAEEAKRIKPTVIVIDTTLPGLDLGGLTRILSRNPTTASAAVVLVAGADAPSKQMHRLKALDAFALVRRPMTCAAIRENVTKAFDFARESSVESAKREAGPRSSRHVVGCNALLRQELLCPFHSFGVPVTHFQLRQGRIFAETDPFDVPIYRNAARDGDFVDYNRAGLIVCPDCFFTTGDPAYFDRPDGHGDDATRSAAHRIDGATRKKVSEQGGLRGLTAFDLLGGEPGETFFGFDRSKPEADAAHQLAIMSSQALYDAAPVRRSIELLRIGNYELRRANLAADPTAARVRREAARLWLGKAFASLKGGAMHKASYQLAAINIYLGDDAAAFPYIKALKDQSRLSRRDQDDPAALERYLRRVQALWADRDIHRAPVAVAA